MHTCHLHTREAGGSKVPGHLQQHSEFQAGLGYLRPFLQKSKIKSQRKPCLGAGGVTTWVGVWCLHCTHKKNWVAFCKALCPLSLAQHYCPFKWRLCLPTLVHHSLVFYPTVRPLVRKVIRRPKLWRDLSLRRHHHWAHMACKGPWQRHLRVHLDYDSRKGNQPRGPRRMNG